MIKPHDFQLLRSLLEKYERSSQIAAVGLMQSALSASVESFVATLAEPDVTGGAESLIDVVFPSLPAISEDERDRDQAAYRAALLAMIEFGVEHGLNLPNMEDVRWLLGPE